MKKRFSLRQWWLRVRKNRLEERMAEEFAFHQDLETARLQGEGLDPEEARWEAAESFGNPHHMARRCRQAALDLPLTALGGRTMTWMQDLRQAIRGLSRQPAFLFIIVLTAAVGIGATTAVFSVVSSVLLNPLPYPEPDRLVRLYSTHIEEGSSPDYLPAPNFVDYREEPGLFSSAGAFYDYRETGMDLTGHGTPRRVRSLAASAGYFEVLGATPLHGRLIAPEEELGTEGRYGAPVTVLSHHLWQSLTGGDPEIVGNTLILDGEAHTVVGVLRPSFLDVLQGEIDLWVPLALDPASRWYSRDNHYLSAVARLAPGVSLEQAQARLDGILAVIQSDLPRSDEGQRVKVMPLFEDVVGSAPPTLAILFGASLLVLLIAAVNVANLLIARGLARRRELAVRAALGSGRFELARQLLLESGIAATLGGLLGIGAAYGGVQALLAVSPESLARSEEVSFDPRLLLFSIAVVGLTALLFGLAPAFQASRVSPSEALRGGSRGGDTSPSGRRWRMGLVASQVALAAVLLIGAGVLLRSFSALHQVPLGFNPEAVLTFEVNLPESRYAEGQERAAFHRSLEERLEALPQVQSAGAISKLPALGPYNTWGVGYLDDQGEPRFIAGEARVVEGAYFETLGIPLQKGRLFDEREEGEGLQTVVVNQTLAQTLWPEQEALGRQIFIGGGEERTVVGVVADVPYDHLGAVRSKLYISHGQYAGNRNWALAHVAKVRGTPTEALAAIRAELAALDGELVLHRPAAFEDLLGRQRAAQRFVLLLMGIFAAVALVLAVIGIYGVLAYTVTQQRREIGIRVALGARPVQVLRSVLGQGLRLAVLGLAVGLPIAWLAGRVLESLLFEASPRDPWVFAAVGIALGAIALGAGLPPARQALRIDPMTAIRED